jgi:hypothetical protein
MKLIFILLFYSFSSALYGQFQIVKDNLGCGYGLMDSTGKWVVQPDYTLIEPIGQNYFVVLNEQGRGLVDFKGKEIISPKYDWISQLNDSIFSIRKNNFFGAFNLSMGEIIPPIHYQLNYQHPFYISFGSLDSKNAIYNSKGEKITQIAYDYSHISIDHILLYTKKGERFFTTRIDIDGNILQPEMEGYYLPFNDFGLAPIGDVGSYSRVNGKAGIINKGGKVITERKYQSIQYCNDKFILLDSNSTTFMDADGSNYKEWECHFQPIISNSYTHVPECLFNDYAWLSRCKDKVGLFNGLGHQLAEPIYDAIEPFSYSQRSETCTYKMYQQGKCGILNMNGKQTIPPDYDELEILEITSHQLNGYEHQLTLFVAKKEEKFGLINEFNQALIPLEYDDFKRNNGYYFSENNEITKVQFNDSISISKGKKILRLDSIDVVQFNNNHLDAFVVNNAKRENVEIQQIGVIKKLSYYDRNSNQLTYLISADNKSKTRIQYIELYQNSAKVHTITGKVGVLNFRTGKFILDTLYRDVSLHYEEYNLVWATKSSTNNWLVFDTLGIKKTPIQFEQIHFLVKPVITKNKNKVGIVNTDFKWMLKPNFLGINRISDSLYLVQTSNQKFGVFKPKTGWVMDTIYTDFEYVANHYLNNWKSKSSISNFGLHPVRDYWYLANKTNKLIFDQTGKKYFAGTKEYDSIMYYSAFSKMERSYVYFTIKLSDKVGLEIAEMPYAKDMYQLLQKRFVKNKTCPFAVTELSTDISCKPNAKRSANPYGIYANIQFIENKKTGKLETIPMNDSVPYYKIPVQEKYTIAFHGKNSVSISIDEHDYNPNLHPTFYGEMPFHDAPRTPDEVQHLPDTILNFYWDGRALQKVDRGQLFSSDSLLNEFLKIAIQNRRDLNLDCNSPSFYSDLIKNECHIFPDGAVFYVRNSRGWFNQIVIPKEVILKQEGISTKFLELFY